ncbi:hypothetical protein [Paenibacillus turpanensis]|uniref:hypothetical protein n=1 Tax=Paenibacillus turpanensis TaxID=2689078 RepID=UPI00140B0906|nr:hypothetical protein [Paenibacillus turpanensis]
MNEERNGGADQIEGHLRQLFQDAGYESKELLDWAKQYGRLLQENERLKQELRKLAAPKKGSDPFSTRLRDALRE